MQGSISTIWAYRGFILGSVKREFQSKYRNSLLGAAWVIINPLAMIIVYTVIFSQLMRARLPGAESTFAYSIFLCAGVLTWGLFSEITNRAQNTFLENANLIKKINFPKLCLPITVVVSASLNFLIIFSLFTIFLVITGDFPGRAFIALLPVLAILVIFAISLGITLGILNVFFRDVGHFFGILLQFWFWLTPIVYPITILPEKLQTIIAFNPMTALISACQIILVYGQWPDWYSLWPAMVTASIFFIISLRLYRQYSGEIVDEL